MLSEVELGEKLGEYGFELSAFVEARGPDKPMTVFASHPELGGVTARGDDAPEKLVRRCAQKVGNRAARKEAS